MKLTFFYLNLRWTIFGAFYWIYKIFHPKKENPNLKLLPKLFDYNEIFVSPCTLNEINCGGYKVKPNLVLNKIQFIGFDMPD